MEKIKIEDVVNLANNLDPDEIQVLIAILIQLHDSKALASRSTGWHKKQIEEQAMQKRSFLKTFDRKEINESKTKAGI